MSGSMVRSGPFEVPAVNSAANNTIRDVLGHKGDTHDGDSAMSKLHLLDDHVHKLQFVVPDLDDAISVTANAPAWEISSAFVEVIAANEIDEPFDLHFVSMTFDANDEYQLQIYAGEVLIASADGERNTNQIRVANDPMQMEMQPANTQIQVKLACKSTNANSATVKFKGHRY